MTSRSSKKRTALSYCQQNGELDELYTSTGFHRVVEKRLWETKQIH